MRGPNVRIRNPFKRGWVFELVYISVAAATFEHTAWAFGTLALGEPASTYITMADPVWVRGALVAVAVDVGMFVVAQQIVEYVGEGHVEQKRKGLFGLAATFLLISMISFFAQLVFAYFHTPSIAVASGVSPYWQEFLYPVIEAAPFVFAACLPLMALAYTLSRIFVTHTEVVKEGIRKDAAEARPHKLEVEGKIKEYKTEAGMNKARARYRTSGKVASVVAEV